ncbi:DUF2118 domain-containing protein [Gordonia sp. HNM0687]|uniref:acetyl-CoA carboxylase n=1 Tax=Gordonia mangrovi TaxID=2665643 RepID=A0A6L7GUA4_9ACTN|nr:DUF2118 domain-containing protein [Gordonia mangrovi]MXP22098.1 DUF2118 domain-containing protein [Gordonia mangrovi]UVF77982.1 DUF2118 domain-containing protein [Gordonia mangrovi]
MKILIANRGEIAVRVISTAAALGIPTVAVHPTDDADCAHVRMADEAVQLEGTGVAAYLDLRQIIAAAIATDCTLLHPGYGFLAENPELARACADHGIGFVGPTAKTLELFGHKGAARDLARERGVPVLPATTAPTDPAAARTFLGDLGPGASVMIKAVAGGGGRGMQMVSRTDEVEAAMARCASEARGAFGDAALYVEQYRPAARHIEVQVIGDGSTTIVLGDRDCSVQRRRQKLIEIAPAPGVSAPLRQRLHHAAIAVAGGHHGLATVEFLVAGDDVVFLEVNPRIQVEHTVTEETTGLDLVELAIRVASGESLSALGLTDSPAPRGAAVQARVNAEHLQPDGSITPGTGTLTRFQPPTGRGIRVDTHGRVDYAVRPRYDSLLAKVIVTGPDTAAAARGVTRALERFDIEGVPVNLELLRNLLTVDGLADGRVDTGFVDRTLSDHLPTGTHEAEPTTEPPHATDPESTRVSAPVAGVVVALPVTVGDRVTPGAELAIIESMKMEHVVRAPVTGTVLEIPVTEGDDVDESTVVSVLAESSSASDTDDSVVTADPAHVRPDLAEVHERLRRTRDEGRVEVVAKRHAKGRLTARESVAGVLDTDTFLEYGALAIAAQRQRRDVDELIARTPADGLITGTGRVHAMPVAIMAYDYTVLAGTQGLHNHRKTDRLLELARRERLPVIVFAEGGGGRPGDTDTSAVAQLDVPTFRLLAELSRTVPTLAVVSGYCFAGNAALAGTCDTIIATEGSSLGMGGPAMIEGGGLGRFAPAEVGPMDVQVANGVVDRLVPDDHAAVDDARRYLHFFAAPRVAAGAAGDQRLLRHLVPENRLRAYPIRPVLEALFDSDSMFEVRRGFGEGIVTALARLEGRTVGVIANNPAHLGGAIDGDGADKAVGFLRLCDSHHLPVVSLCDTPGFMVGPAAERTATVRRFSAMFRAGATLRSPLVLVVVRKAYGLGAMAMAGGDLHARLITLSWPTGEFGGMGLEGAVRLGYRDQLAAIADPAERQRRYADLVAMHYERGKALNVASVCEIDAVIDPTETRAAVCRALELRDR